MSPKNSSSTTFQAVNPAKTVKQFCKKYGISVATYYRNFDSMPQGILIGKARRIPWEDEAAWRANFSEKEGTL